MIGLGSSSCTDARVLGPRIEPAPTPPDYGPLAPAGPELALPAGFEYAVIGVEGTPMADGRPTPRAHDGMGAFRFQMGIYDSCVTMRIGIGPPSQHLRAIPRWRMIRVEADLPPHSRLAGCAPTPVRSPEWKSFAIS